MLRRTPKVLLGIDTICSSIRIVNPGEKSASKLLTRSQGNPGLSSTSIELERKRDPKRGMRPYSTVHLYRLLVDSLFLTPTAPQQALDSVPRPPSHRGYLGEPGRGAPHATGLESEGAILPAREASTWPPTRLCRMQT